MFRPAFMFVLMALFTSAKAAELGITPTPPELRVGLHALTPEVRNPWIFHLMFPNILSGTDTALYLGKRWQVSKFSSLETLLGTGLSVNGLNPAVSVRFERLSELTYVWADLEYAPLAHQNVYGYATVAWRASPYIMVGLDTENWINLVRASGSPHQTHWSVGPTVGFKIGRDLFLQEALLWTGDELIPRTYAQWWF